MGVPGSAAGPLPCSPGTLSSGRLCGSQTSGTSTGVLLMASQGRGVRPAGGGAGGRWGQRGSGGRPASAPRTLLFPTGWGSPAGVSGLLRSGGGWRGRRGCAWVRTRAPRAPGRRDGARLGAGSRPHRRRTCPAQPLPGSLAAPRLCLSSGRGGALERLSLHSPRFLWAPKVMSVRPHGGDVEQRSEAP